MLGVIYARAEIKTDELRIQRVRELGGGAGLPTTVTKLADIPAVVRDLKFLAQPKYCIARDQPGSGNTKNIGAISNSADLLNGNGPFATLGEAVFDQQFSI